MVAIFLPECGGGGCSRVEHQRMGTSPVMAGSSTTPSGSGTGWGGGFEVETRYWVVRLHASPGLSGLGVCGWSSLTMDRWLAVVVGVGLFLENYIVDASIL
ncbi:hypothetical protein GCM10009626_43740 [Brachybacterium sacelli]